MSSREGQVRLLGPDGRNPNVLRLFLWSRRFEMQLKLMMGISLCLVALTAVLVWLSARWLPNWLMMVYFAALTVLLLDYSLLFGTADQARVSLFWYGLQPEAAAQLVRGWGRWLTTLPDQTIEDHHRWLFEEDLNLEQNLAGHWRVQGRGWFVSGFRVEGVVAGAEWVRTMVSARQGAIARLASRLEDQGVTIHAQGEVARLEFPASSGIEHRLIERDDYDGWLAAYRDLDGRGCPRRRGRIRWLAETSVATESTLRGVA